MTLPSHLPSTCTKQTTYSLFLTNSNNMLYCRGLIRALGLSVPASLMRPRRAVLQTPPKSSVLLRLPFYKSCPPLTHAQSTLLQLLISIPFQLPQNQRLQKTGEGVPPSRSKDLQLVTASLFFIPSEASNLLFLASAAAFLPHCLVTSLLLVPVGVHTHRNASNIFSSQLVARHCSGNSFLCRSFRSLATH
jgi:hypothetical protein